MGQLNFQGKWTFSTNIMSCLIHNQWSLSYCQNILSSWTRYYITKTKYILWHFPIKVNLWFKGGLHFMSTFKESNSNKTLPLPLPIRAHVPSWIKPLNEQYHTNRLISLNLNLHAVLSKLEAYFQYSTFNPIPTNVFFKHEHPGGGP